MLQLLAGAARSVQPAIRFFILRGIPNVRLCSSTGASLSLYLGGSTLSKFTLSSRANVSAPSVAVAAMPHQIIGRWVYLLTPELTVTR